MSYDVAALPFQANGNYGTWSIDFGKDVLKLSNNLFLGHYVFQLAEILWIKKLFQISTPNFCIKKKLDYINGFPDFIKPF